MTFGWPASVYRGHMEARVWIALKTQLFKLNPVSIAWSDKEYRMVVQLIPDV